MIKKTVLILMIIILLSGCEALGELIYLSIAWTPEVEYFGYNNWNTLFIPDGIGDGTYSGSLLSRPIIADIETDLDIEISTPYVFGSPLTSCMYCYLPVTNIGVEYYSFITLSDVYFSGTGGALNSDPDLSYIHGSVAAFESGIFSSACLAPGESGYFIFIDTDIDRSDVWKIEGVISESGFILGQPDSVVYAEDVTYNPDSLYLDDLEITCKNYSSTTAIMDWVHVMFFDEYMQPTNYEIIRPSILDEKVYSYLEQTVSESYCHLYAYNYFVLVHIDFDDDVTFRDLGTSSQKEMLQARNQQIESKLRTLGRQ